MIKKFCLSLLCIALAVPVLAQDKQRLKDASGVLKEVLNSNAGFPKPLWTRLFVSWSSRGSRRLAPV